MRRAVPLLLGLVVGLVVCAGVSSCGPGAKPAQADDGPRIVAFSPAIAIILRDLGLADRIVARHAWDIVLPESVPTVGDQRGLDYEALLRTDPTHIVLQWGTRDLPPRLVTLAGERGWQLVNLETTTLAELDSAIAHLHRYFGRPGAAPSVGGALREHRLSAWPGPILLLAALDPPAAVGPGSFHHDMLLALGLEPAIGAQHPLAAPWIELDAEDVLRLAPAGIILLAPGLAGEPELGVLGEIGLAAVEAGRVGVVRDELALIPSTALVGVARRMAEIVQSWDAAASPSPREPPEQP